MPKRPKCVTKKGIKKCCPTNFAGKKDLYQLEFVPYLSVNLIDFNANMKMDTPALSCSLTKQDVSLLMPVREINVVRKI